MKKICFISTHQRPNCSVLSQLAPCSCCCKPICLLGWMCTEKIKSGPVFHLLKREAKDWRITVFGPLQLLAILCGKYKWCLVQPVLHPQHSQAPQSLLHISEGHPCSLITNLSIKNSLKRHSAKGESQLHLPLSCVKAWREQPSGTSETPALCQHSVSCNSSFPSRLVAKDFPCFQIYTTGLG